MCILNTALEIAIKSTEINEGWAPKPYIDINGHSTGMYGRNFDAFPFTKEEANIWTTNRLNDICKKLSFNFIFKQLSDIRKSVLLEMAYQLGIEGLSNFDEMWEALSKKDYEAAAQAIWNSLLQKESPTRTEKYAYRMQYNRLD